jgi:hypothetical protein
MMSNPRFSVRDAGVSRREIDMLVVAAALLSYSSEY